MYRDTIPITLHQKNHLPHLFFFFLPKKPFSSYRASKCGDMVWKWDPSLPASRIASRRGEQQGSTGCSLIGVKYLGGLMIFKHRILVVHIVLASPVILAYLFKYICILYFRGNPLSCSSPAASAMLSFTLLPWCFTCFPYLCRYSP